MSALGPPLGPVVLPDRELEALVAAAGGEPARAAVLDALDCGVVPAPCAGCGRHAYLDGRRCCGRVFHGGACAVEHDRAAHAPSWGRFKSWCGR